MPSWLRDEIKKAVITSSSMDHPKEETQSFEDEGFDRSFGKGDQADSKSIDSSRPTEEEDDEVLLCHLKMIHFESVSPLVNCNFYKIAFFFFVHIFTS